MGRRSNGHRQWRRMNEQDPSSRRQGQGQGQGGADEEGHGDCTRPKKRPMQVLKEAAMAAALDVTRRKIKRPFEDPFAAVDGNVIEKKATTEKRFRKWPVSIGGDQSELLGEDDVYLQRNEQGQSSRQGAKNGGRGQGQGQGQGGTDEERHRVCSRSMQVLEEAAFRQRMKLFRVAFLEQKLKNAMAAEKRFREWPMSIGLDEGDQSELLDEESERVWTDAALLERKPWEKDQMITDVESLPFHLVFDRLPVRQLFQLRCVSRLWNSMLGGAALATGELLANAKEDREEYWFVMAERITHAKRIWKLTAFCKEHDEEWAFFHLPLKSRSHGRLAALLGGVCCRLLSQADHGFYVGCPRLVSAGGLMCALVHKPGVADDYHVIVFNFLTGSVKVLPPPLDPHRLFCDWSTKRPEAMPKACNMYMAIDDQDPARYYIMLTHLRPVLSWAEHEDPYFEVYDSRRGCWRVTADYNSAAVISNVPNGYFFHFYAKMETLHLLAYHVMDDVWSKVEVPLELGDEFCVYPFLFKYQGKLLQCRILKPNDEDSTCLGFGVWELRANFSEGATWVEVARTPKHLWQWLPLSDRSEKIMAEGSLLYMSLVDFQPPLVYDIAQNLWYVLPLQRGTTNSRCILVIRPRLSMRVPYLDREY